MGLNNVCVYITTTIIRMQNSFLALKILSYYPFAVNTHPTPNPWQPCLRVLFQNIIQCVTF